MMRKILNLMLLSVFLTFSAGAAKAQEVQKIVAIVNEEVISGFDVIQRISLRILMGGLQDTRATREQLVPSTINALIDDRLKAQEAARYNISATDAEINAAIERFEKRYRIRPGMAEQALGAKNISLDALIDEIRVAIAWDKLVRRRIIPRVNVTDEEIAAEQERLRANKGKAEYLIREVFMAVNTPTDETKVNEQINNLYGQLKQGADFERVATQFSEGPTAATGGEVGWFMAEELEPALAQVVAGKEGGTLLQPVRGQDGYYIVEVEQVRKILSDQQGDAMLNLAQIAVPMSLAEGTGRAESQKALAASLSNFINSCDYLPQLFQQVSNPQTGPMGQAQLSKLPDHVKKLVSGLEAGQASQPYLDKDIYRVFIVCDRQDANQQSDDENVIRQKLGRTRIEARIDRYLNDLRREAVIESR